MRRNIPILKNRFALRKNADVRASQPKRRHSVGRRVRGAEPTRQEPCLPTEDWHDPVLGAASGYRVVVRVPGPGYRHVVTPEEIRQRLADVPSAMLERLQVVQLSRMTRKKMTYPCYGMQWGSTVYLYPMEAELEEFYAKPPLPTQRIDARMYGGRWVEESGVGWRLIWTEQSIRDYYLNNVLLHELGHMLDDRNRSYVDRERFANWFAIQYGYRPAQRRQLARQAASRLVRRRHDKR